MSNVNYSKKLLVTLMSLLVCFASVAQTVSISGTVTDANNQPLIGATVVVAGTSIGATTDLKGAYKINVPNKDASIEVSYIGYQNQTIAVQNRPIVNVIMKEDSRTMDEVVVIGYGVQKKSHLTGSISKVDGSALVDMPVSDVAQALQGKIAGVVINNNTSEVGVTPEIRVRGFGSISAQSSPYVVVDGFPVADGLSSINPGDIASIEVLKDASSAAIYGSKAANGVILITTKSGSVNAPKYTVKLYTGMKYAYKLHDLMTDGEFYNMTEREAALGGKAPTSNYKLAAWLEQMNGATDWQQEALRDFTSIYSAQFSVSGGKKEVRYFVSANYTKDQGLMLQNQVEKMNVRSKVDFVLSKHVDAGINMSATYSQSDRPMKDFINFYRTPSSLPVRHNDFTSALTKYTGYARGNHFTSIWFPWANTAEPGSENWDNGNPVWQQGNLSTSAQNNPRTILDLTSRSNEQFQTIGNAYLKINIAKDFTFLTSNGFNYRMAPAFTYMMANAEKDGDASTATYKQSLMVDLLTENTLTYMKDVGGHSFNAMLGFTAQKTRRENLALSGTGFPTDKIKTLNAATVFNLLDSNGKMATGTFREPDEARMSYLARLNYAYENKYLVSLATRLDQSSRFASGHRDAWFPSVSVGWRLTEEKFMKKIDWINTLKIRASYGVTGNDGVDYTASENVYSPANYPFGEGQGSIVAGMANTSNVMSNPLLTWEQTNEWDFGADIGLFNNRLQVVFDYYYSTTKALLLKQAIPSFTGFTQAWNNIGKVRNSGIELGLDAGVMRKNNFNWNIALNLSTGKNKVLELGGERQLINYGERNEYYLTRVGDPITQYYGYKFIGVWNTPEEVAANPSMQGDAPGKARFADMDGSGDITPADMIPLGDPYPDFTWGLTSTMQWKNFDLTLLFQGVQGVTVMNGDGYYNETMRWNRAWTNNRWISPQYPGDGKTVTIEAGADNARLPLSDYYFDNASYATLRNATLGYSFSKKVLKKIHLSGLRLYASGNNLFYIWSKNARTINPESRMTSGDYSNPLVRGYQRGGYPITSTITFGIDLTF